MLKNSGYSRTDLACESQAVNGAGKRREYRRGEFVCSELIISKDEEAYFEKKAGRYVTMSPGKLWLWDDEKAESFAGALADELIRFTEEAISGEITPETSVLVCGLGNRFITADALGPQTLDKLTVTRHMMGNGGIFDLARLFEHSRRRSGNAGADGHRSTAAPFRRGRGGKAGRGHRDRRACGEEHGEALPDGTAFGQRESAPARESAIREAR